jgi:hypothetical protein
MENTPLAPTRFRRQTLTSSGTIWTAAEDELLKKLVSETPSVSWCAIAPFFPNKTAPQLASRWDKVLNPRLVKGSWTHEEDEAIMNFVQQNGDKDWARLAAVLQDRTGKQCRERYKNHLDQSVNHADWTAEEDEKLGQLHALYGNAWTKLAVFFTGRTDNCIKNRWNSTIRKRLERLERGEPLVMKRGRKPKSAPLAAPASSEEPRESSSCTSPLEPAADTPRVPTIEILPLNEAIRAKIAAIEHVELPPLAQNRMDFERLLAGRY